MSKYIAFFQFLAKLVLPRCTDRSSYCPQGLKHPQPKVLKSESWEATVWDPTCKDAKHVRGYSVGKQKRWDVTRWGARKVASYNAGGYMQNNEMEWEENQTTTAGGYSGDTDLEAVHPSY